MTHLLVTGRVRTQDPDRPVAEAVAVAGSRIVAVGDRASVRDQVPDGTPELSFPYVVPGFVDSHVHVLWAGRAASRLALPSASDVLARVARFAADHPGADWIEADANFDGPLPSAAALEAAAPGVAVVIDVKGHDAVVNETALRRAGIGDDTPDPPGGRIERGPGGRATGLLVEHPAVALVRAAMPAPRISEQRDWIRAGQAELLRHGITTAVDPAVDASGLRAYEIMAADGALRTRIVAMPHGVDSLAVGSPAVGSPALGSPALAETDRLRLGPTKIFLDGGGSLGTALLSRPWPGTDGYYGNQTTTRADLAATMASAPRGVGVHAVGDAAIDLVLDVVAEVRPAAPCHLIHAYLGPSPAAMERARALGVAVSAHPALQWGFGAGLIERLGWARAAAANPLRSWLDAGVLVGGGSDAPGPPMSVLRGMWQARTRMARGVDLPLGPAEAIGAAEAFDLFTTGAAAIAGFGSTGAAAGFGSTGRLRVGDPADVAGLTVDPLTVDPSEMYDGRVLATIVDGVVEFAE